MEERRSFADVAAGRNQSKDEQDEEGMSKTGTEEESEEEKEPAQEEARRENVAPSPVGLEDGVTVHGAQCRRWRGRRRGRRRTRSLLQRTRDHNDQNHKDQIKWTPTKQTTNKQTTKHTTTINNNNKQTKHITKSLVGRLHVGVHPSTKEFLTTQLSLFHRHPVDALLHLPGKLCIDAVHPVGQRHLHKPS